MTSDSHPLQHFLERIMSNALEEHGKISMDALAEKEQEQEAGIRWRSVPY